MTALRTVVLAGAAVLAAGCDGKPTTGVGADATAARYFREHQADTETPNGRIVTDSVEAAGGTIKYRTADGKAWRVKYTRRADGTYQYGTPEEVR
jgi:hypothetical protein